MQKAAYKSIDFIYQMLAIEMKRLRGNLLNLRPQSLLLDSVVSHVIASPNKFHLEKGK